METGRVSIQASTLATPFIYSSTIGQTFTQQNSIYLSRFKLYSYICEIELRKMTATKQKFTEKQELVAKYGNALANPVRVAILELLSRQSCCFHGDMAEELPIANSTLSQHLKVLKEAGLIQGEINPPKIKYCINKENWAFAKGLLIGFFD